MVLFSDPGYRFMPADAFWTLAMAVNVYLTFYYKFDAEKLRRMEIWYFLFCYGLPFIPALAYIFITNKDGNRVYGNANLWCWISRDWDIYRIATFYGPVWYEHPRSWTHSRLTFLQDRNIPHLLHLSTGRR